ncbi:class I tRNA ligase family protein, partial [Patescibacteria group bacterium]|nr:class I tRNA ligase family protein [Patescibacteria group bacterium]
MQEYNHKTIEQKWQKYWENNKTNFCDLEDKTKIKFYNLVMFYYPSGDKIHIGHGYNFTGSDVFGRYKRMKGFNVFQPMGADAFGLPAENYAIKTGVHPAESTRKNIDYSKQQLKELGLMYDWSKEIDTSSPEYYKWTQWIFSVLYKAGLAYQAEAPVNWCPSCKTVLANEQVVSGKCERCDFEVIQKNLKQWFFKITDYADRLLKDHNKINWPKKTITMQKNWIGRSEGALIKFPIYGTDNQNYLEVFTTRPDTLFGATFMVVAPEHKLISNFKFQISNYNEVEKYIKKSQSKSELERTDLNKDKSGVELKGIKAINPVNKKEIPIFVADYVLMNYGTGAIMAVPAHDERDFEFAVKYGLQIIEVIKQDTRNKIQETNKSQSRVLGTNSKSQILVDKCFCGEGVNINSEFLNKLKPKDAIVKIITWLEV